MIYLSFHSSSDQSHGPNVLLLVLGPVGAVLLIVATAFAVFKYRQLKRSGESRPFLVSQETSAILRQRRYLSHAAICAGLSCSPGTPVRDGQTGDPASPTDPIHTAPTPSLQGAQAEAETEATPLWALHVALHGVSLHRGSLDTNALAPTEQACRVFISSLLTDLVSVGSYRTNISMSDFESVKEYSASNNACVKESQETQIGGDGRLLTDGLALHPQHKRCRGRGLQKYPTKATEIPAHRCPPHPNTSLSLPAEFIATTATPESAAETKKAKRVRGGRREPTDLGGTATALQPPPKELSSPRGLIYTQVLSILPGSGHLLQISLHEGTLTLS